VISVIRIVDINAWYYCDRALAISAIRIVVINNVRALLISIIRITDISNTLQLSTIRIVDIGNYLLISQFELLISTMYRKYIIRIVISVMYC